MSGIAFPSAADIIDISANGVTLITAANFAAMKTALGLGTADSPVFVGVDSSGAALTLGNATDGVTVPGDASFDGEISASQGLVGSEAFGTGATISSVNQTFFGNGTSGGAYSTCIGNNASAPSTNWNQNGIAIGLNAFAGTHRIALMGQCTAANQFVAGHTYCDVQDVYFGRGVIDATPGTTTIRGTANSTTNGSGGDLRLQGGLPDGSGSHGDLLLQPDGGDVVVTGAATFSLPVIVGTYTFATTPTASLYTLATISVSDRAAKLAYSDGSNWRWVFDNAIIS